MHPWFRRLAISGSLALFAHASGYAQSEPSLVVQAGVNFQRVGNFVIRSDPTYRGAIRAFGEASSCELVRRPADAVAVWRTLGIRIRLATFGGLPEGETGCTAPDLIWIDRLDVTGRQWRTARGLRIGDSGFRLRQLYPKVQYRTPAEGFFPNSYFLVQVRQRCVIGTCPNPFETVPRLVAKMRNGRVSAFVFPVGAQGE